MKNAGIRKVEIIRARRLEIKNCLSQFDAADDNVQWITVNGTHVPVKDGEAVGGPAALKESLNKGKDGKKGGGSGAGTSAAKKSVPTAKVNGTIKSKWGQKGKYEAVEKDINDALGRMEDGDTFEMNGFSFEKKGKNEYVSTNKDDGGEDKWSASELKGYIKDSFGDYESEAPKFEYMRNKADVDDPGAVKLRNRKIEDMWANNDPHYGTMIEKTADLMRHGDSIKIGELKVGKTKDGFIYEDPRSGNKKKCTSSADIAKYISGLSDYVDAPPVFKFEKDGGYTGQMWM